MADVPMIMLEETSANKSRVTVHSRCVEKMCVMLIPYVVPLLVVLFSS